MLANSRSYPKWKKQKYSFDPHRTIYTRKNPAWKLYGGFLAQLVGAPNASPSFLSCKSFSHAYIDGDMFSVKPATTFSARANTMRRIEVDEDLFRPHHMQVSMQPIQTCLAVCVLCVHAGSACNQFKHAWLHNSCTNARHVCLCSFHGHVHLNQPVCEPPVDAEHAVYVYIHTHSICHIRFITSCASATRACASSSLGYVLKVCDLRSSHRGTIPRHSYTCPQISSSHNRR
jgi:hypothetical protein